MIDNKQEYILCAAIYIKDGVEYNFQPTNIRTGIVFCGWRHPGIIQQCNMANLPWKEWGYIQGFITSKNRFVDREEAFIIACKANQIRDSSKFKMMEKVKQILFSEDIY